MTSFSLSNDSNTVEGKPSNLAHGRMTQGARPDSSRQPKGTHSVKLPKDLRPVKERNLSANNHSICQRIGKAIKSCFCCNSAE